MNITNQYLKKLLGPYLLLLLLIPGLVFATSPKNVGENRSKAALNNFTITFWPTTSIFQVNKNYDIEIKLDPNNKPSSLDLVISYDPKIIEISPESPIPGNIYDTYQARFTDNSKGLSGITGKGELRPNGSVFAKYKITTKSVGDPKIAINYAKAQGEDIKIPLPIYSVK